MGPKRSSSQPDSKHAFQTARGSVVRRAVGSDDSAAMRALSVAVSQNKRVTFDAGFP
jgi:hypothetical protein